MRVLFVSSGNSKFGISPVIKNQGDSLRREGLNLDYFVVKGRGILGYFKNIKLLRFQQNQNKYDLIHTHYALTALVQLLTMKRTPLVISFMGDDVLGSQNSRGKYSIKGKLITFLSRFVLSHLSLVNIVKSVEMQEIVPNSIVVPNGVDFNKFREMSKENSLKMLGLNNNKTIILFPANPNREEKNFKLAELSVNKLRLDNVLLLNFNETPNELTPYYYNSASVVLLTSFHEGSPNVIKEAMACNIPIVSTDVGDVKKIIGKTKGCYVASFDSEDIAYKLRMAISFGKKTSGRLDIMHLEESIIAKKIINIYEKKMKN